MLLLGSLSRILYYRHNPRRLRLAPSYSILLETVASSGLWDVA